ncbi:MAG: FAD-binding oxidoreductase, partial [Longimicrobiales bacterium]
AGTWLSGGAPAPQPPLVLSASRLAAVHEYEPSDLTIGIGAGVSHGALRATTAPHAQWLPLDPPAAPTATLGATVSTAAAGPLRAAFGTPRDHVLGLEIVTGDGRVLAFGGRVVKNVAGYDLVRLMTGSHGTLGFITRLHLRLRPRPPLDRALRCEAAAPDPLLALSAALQHRRLEPAALELLSPPADRRRGWSLLVRFQGVEARVAAAVAEVRAITEAGPCDEVDWEREVDHGEADAALLVRLADRPSRLAATLRLARSLAEALDVPPGSGPPPRIAAHLTAGIVRVWQAEAAWTQQQLSGIVGAITAARDQLAGRAGSVIIAIAPPALLERVPPWPAPGPALALMRGLKAHFDPDGVLAPHRFIV